MEESNTAGLIKRSDSDMTTGSIWKLLVKFAIPMAIGLLFQQFYNTVDSIVVGRFVGKEALAAVGSTSSIINMIVGLCAGLSMGANVVISQCYGAHDNKKLHDAVHTTISISFLICVVATALGVVIVPSMLKLMDTPADVFNDAKTYLTIYFAGVTGVLLYNMGSGILRAVGDSKRPLYFLCFTALLNTALDLLLVIKFGLGIKGVAYATVASQVLSAILVLYSLTRTSAPYAIHWSALRICPSTLKRILSIGLPSAIQQAVTSFSNVFVQSYINGFGSDCMAGWSSYNKLDIFAIIPVQSIALASTTFVGQNFGAGKLDRARKGVRQSLIMSIIITEILSVLLILFRRDLLLLFTTDEKVIEYGAWFIAVITPFYFTVCFNQVLAGALRGVGNAKVPTIIMLSSFVLFRQIYLYVVKLLGNSFVAISLGYPVGWIVCSTLMIVFYLRSSLHRAPSSSPKASDVINDEAVAAEDMSGMEQ